MAYRSWSTGDTVDAAAFTYIADAVVNVFSSTSNRDSLVTTPTTGMLAYTTDSDTLYYYSSAGSWVASTLAADITGIVTAANSSLAGGATSGEVTLTADVNNTTSATATGADYVLIADTDDSNATKKALISDITALTVTSVTGTSPIASSGGLTPAISVDTTDAQFILSNQVFVG